MCLGCSYQILQDIVCVESKLFCVDTTPRISVEAGLVGLSGCVYAINIKHVHKYMSTNNNEYT